MKRVSRIGVLIVGLSVLAALGVSAPRAGDNLAPRFEVDAGWPKPLPNRWLMGQAAGVAVDAQDHIWVVQRPRSLTEDERGASLQPPRSLCCVAAPPVLQLSRESSTSWAGWGLMALHAWRLPST